MDASEQNGRAPRRSELIARLERAAPTGLAELDEPTLARLRAITADLLRVTDDAAAECERFEAQTRRALAPPGHALGPHGVGEVVVVTGGTGCVGSALLEEIERHAPRRIVCLSRGLQPAVRRSAAVDYLRVDVGDRSAARDAILAIAPDTVFHLAGERHPSVAERAVVETLTTNAIGTKNVLDASAEAGVASFVYASTGKALCPYTPHLYAASKKVGELLTLMAARRNVAARYAIARFTHVVDNSFVLERFRAAARGDALRLHDANTVFYTQSARESAQLLLCANANARAGGAVDIHAIQDLGMPARLLDLALGVVASGRGADALYVQGYEPGYDDSYYPGLYDPETAADVSPLLNAFEAAHAREVGETGVDASEVAIAEPERFAGLVDALVETCMVIRNPAQARVVVAELATELLDATLTAAEPATLQRLARLTAPWTETMSESNLLIEARLRATIAAGRHLEVARARKVDVGRDAIGRVAERRAA